MLLKRGRSAKTRRDKAVALEMNPNKTTRGDLRGRRADLKGSEMEVSDLRKIRLKLGKFKLLKHQRLSHKKWRVLEP